MLTSKDKYLKCVKSDEISPVTYPATATSAITNEGEPGLNVDLLNRIKRYVLIIVVIVLFIQAFVMVKYLYKHFYFQNFLKLLAGNLVINEGVIEQWKNPDCGKSGTKTGKKS